MFVYTTFLLINFYESLLTRKSSFTVLSFNVIDTFEARWDCLCLLQLGRIEDTIKIFIFHPAKEKKVLKLGKVMVNPDPHNVRNTNNHRNKRHFISEKMQFLIVKENTWCQKGWKNSSRCNQVFKRHYFALK